MSVQFDLLGSLKAGGGGRVPVAGVFPHRWIHRCSAKGIDVREAPVPFVTSQGVDFQKFFSLFFVFYYLWLTKGFKGEKETKEIRNGRPKKTPSIRLQNSAFSPLFAVLC